MSKASSDNPDPARTSLAERYEIREPLGQGGMAMVYRAFDRVRQIEVALKQLTVTGVTLERSTVAALFEREFQTLAQLSHPSVIAVYDFGLPTDTGPYYTMELLDGGDLLECAPLPWREACAMMFDVCSSLSLLHSRGLLHRDISPRNIHRTRAGKAKLIDFGAVAAMCPGGAQIVGTPAFCAPETLHKLALDARTDLYSLGVTLYYVLTGHLPYPGRTFADMLVAWTAKVPSPSLRNPELPAALEDLVLALIHPEPELRPPSAYAVMQRLAAAAGLEVNEAQTVQQAYLVTPTLLGRTEHLKQLRKQLTNARLRRGSGALIQGSSGSGRSRLLDACALEAKTLGFNVLRAVCSGSNEMFGVARALVQHLLQAWPSASNEPDADPLFVRRADPEAPAVFRQFDGPGVDPSLVQRAFCQLLLRVSRTRPLLIAVDDVHRIDPPSAAVLAALLDGVEAHLFLALTSDSGAPQSDASHALSRRCQLLEPAALTRAETQELLRSLFGDVPHLAFLSEEIYKLAAGNPRRSIDLAQHLLDRGLVRYDAGTWILPSGLAAEDLPRDAAQALHARIERLSPTARWLAQAQALAFVETFTVQQYHALCPELRSAQVEQALTELLRAQVLVLDGERYSLANRAWTSALSELSTPSEQIACHRALKRMYEGRLTTAQVHHAFRAGLAEEGLDRLVQRHAAYEKTRLEIKQLVDENVPKMVWCYEPAIATAIELERSGKLVNDLRRWQLAGSIAVEWGAYSESARLWFEQLAHDSGLALFRADTEAKPEERLTRALQAAYQRFLATPEAERVYAVDEAIRLLAEYVVYCIALGSRAADMTLLRSLPAILEPFAPLSPLLDAIWNNAVATYELAVKADSDAAYARWSVVLGKLDALSGGEMQHIEPIRNAVVYALAVCSVQIGRTSSLQELAARLDNDPYQSVAALTLRKVERLQQGDYRGAEQYRRRAELLALELRWPQMFKSTLLVEAWTYARIGDLAALRDVIEQLRQLSTRFPGWSLSVLCTEGAFHQVRGDFHAARTKYEECLSLAPPDDQGPYSFGLWLAAQNGLAEALFHLDWLEEARAVASAGLKVCEERQLASASTDFVCVLSLTEAKLGHAESAVKLLDTLIARQEELGVTGLRIGLCYEARARVALWTGDQQGFERYARVTAQAYRHGARSPLGARYERLLNEAKRMGTRGADALPELVSTSAIASQALATQDLLTIVARSLTGKTRVSERAEAALGLLCSARNTSAGHLYLCSPGGLVLCASRGPAPHEPLVQAAEAFLEQESARSEQISDMVTGELAEQAEASVVMDADQGTQYELLLLSCLVKTTRTPIAVAAVAVSEVAMDGLRQAQLLQLLAAHLQRDATQLT